MQGFSYLEGVGPEIFDIFLQHVVVLVYKMESLCNDYVFG